jgi:NADPH:quinone reductase-like Zn-dependent oxidoreductase
MEAVICTKYGPPEVLQIQEVDKPTPNDDEVLIRVCATSVTTYDCWVRTATAPPGFGLLARLDSGLTKPKQPILGTELAGQIEAKGKDVTRFRQGDQVYAFAAMMGAYVEYICLPEAAVALKPENASYEEAAAVLQGALTAWFFLRKANVQSGQKVLIFGASGGVGMYAVQLARYLGAEVTGVCSASKMDLVRSLGTDKLIDYTQEDFTQSGEIYDVIFDTVGKTPVLRSKKVLKPNGCYIFATFGMPLLIRMLWLSLTSNRKVIFGLLKEQTEDLIFLKELIETGKLKVVIDRSYPLEQIVDAHRYVEQGHKKGNVVITVAPAASH